MFQSITRIYKLNIPNIFYWSPKITVPRILSCHFRWLAIVMPVKHLKNTNQYFKISGYYTSYHGTDFDSYEDCLKEVFPEEKTITVYR